MKRNLDRLYQDMILEHNRSPRNFKELSEASHLAHGKNPLCGDDYMLYLDIRDGVVDDIGFKGEGCAISKSSASLMTSMMKGKSVEECEFLKDCFIEMTTTKDSSCSCEEKMGRLKVFEGVRKYPVRVKCATLIWRTLESALKSDIGAKAATTE